MQGRLGLSVLVCVVLWFCTPARGLRLQGGLTRHGEGLEMSGASLVFQLTARSTIACASLCQRTPACRTVTVTRIPGSTSVTCSGHSDHVTGSTFSVEPLASVFTFNDDWLDSTCSQAADCGAQFSDCVDGACTCSPGYYYSLTRFLCLATCEESQLQTSRYLEYPGYIISGYNIECNSGAASDLPSCQQACSSNPQVRTCDLWLGVNCCLQLVTKLQAETSWQADSSFLHFQKTCF